MERIRAYLQKRFIRFLIKDVFLTVSKEDILRKTKNGWEWKGRELGPETMGSLKEEAALFTNSLLWKVLRAELQWQAIKTLMEKGTDGSDIRAAQLLGYLTQVIDDKLKDISNER